MEVIGGSASHGSNRHSADAGDHCELAAARQVVAHGLVQVGGCPGEQRISTEVMAKVRHHNTPQRRSGENGKPRDILITAGSHAAFSILAFHPPHCRPEQSQHPKGVEHGLPSKCSNDHWRQQQPRNGSSRLPRSQRGHGTAAFRFRHPGGHHPQPSSRGQALSDAHQDAARDKDLGGDRGRIGRQHRGQRPQSHGEEQHAFATKTSGQKAADDLGGSIAPKNGTLNNALL
mmetsp:Transcript_79815/g.125946  ORF Transcript_79815/g.125946 Transcript_79815/m.125946 type:complete len:231 (+) Transcript_79815:510-1202(+)